MKNNTTQKDIKEISDLIDEVHKLWEYSCCPEVWNCCRHHALTHVQLVPPDPGAIETRSPGAVHPDGSRAVRMQGPDY